ncbi:hypothetical protein N7532_000501 [Penicillium argentinense]|uniref:ATP-dependent protease n=1 Tax=Penicillium argentinense TaxID=1131581 RepID=A0A9W9KNX2_9EURO|nr:uncharacterized protein N7532_000501 [Penicillium argentinense]KAJ5112456.1 hypothetical protein N7532_000501 [Penicillium argentinense]
MENTEAAPAAQPPPPAQADEADSLTVEGSDVSSLEECDPHVVTRLIQCKNCSRPLHTPVRLPCGNTVCRSCLPPARPRMGITYPAAEGRAEEFTCYWKGTIQCAGEHCVDDCGIDVVLCNMTDVFQEELGFPDSDTEAVEPRQSGQGRTVRWKVGRKDTKKPEAHVAEVGNHGWLRGLYLLAWEGRFPYDAFEITYEAPDEPSQGTEDHYKLQNISLFKKVRNRLRSELDCQVCYTLILDPLTTPCGHTFCRKCIARALNHTDLCPVCRRKVGMPSAMESEPLNRTLANLIELFFHDQLADRREVDAQDELWTDHEKNLPLFVCTLSFPTMPNFLHIFEPRYRLMIRRVVDNGDGKFGMVMYNRRGQSQGEGLGSVPFMQYGTLLVIERYELLPDGRSLVIATGMSRFKVLEASELDGYHVACTERVNDINLAEEERLEATETAAAAIPDPSLGPNAEPPLDSMSTQELFTFLREYVRKQHYAGAPWLHPRVMLAYGPVPRDAARFPWWFASIIPISEEEKYPILSARSVRERLKISARWARELKARDWYFQIEHTYYIAIL